MNEGEMTTKVLTEEGKKPFVLPIFDELTGLYSRNYIDTILTEQYGVFKRNFQRFGLVMLGIDEFGKINDNFGEEAKMEVLKFVASVLRRSIRSSDFLARFEEDKFIIVCPFTELDGIEKLSQRIIEFLHSSVFASTEKLAKISEVSVSIGGTIADYKDRSSVDVVVRTEKGMERAKQEGGARYFLD